MDLAVGLLAPNQGQLTLFQITKNLVFVLLAAGLLFQFLTRQRWRQEQELAVEERRSREIQAIGDLATLALSGRPLAEIFGQAVKRTDELLEFDAVLLIEFGPGSADGSISVRSAAGKPAFDPTKLNLKTQTGPEEGGFPIYGAAGDVHGSLTVHPPDAASFESGFVSEIRTSEGRYGCLAVLHREERDVGGLHWAFVRGLTHVLGLAVERAGWIERLTVTAEQQRGLARLGSVALGAHDPERVFEQAAQVVATHLSLDCVGVYEYSQADGLLRLVGGSGWAGGWVGELALPANGDSHAALAHEARQPVVAEMISEETQFRTTRLLDEHAIVSLADVLIEGGDDPFGVLSAGARDRRRFADDELVFLQAVANIVSEAVRRERTQAKNRFQSQLLDSVAEAVIASDVDGQVRYWNRGAELTYGWSEEEAIGRSLQSLTVADESQREAAGIMARVMRGETWSGEFRVRNKEGEVFSAFVTDTPIYNREGEIEGVIGVSRDLREIRRAERELAESEAFHRLVLSNISDAVFLTDEPGEFKFVCVNTHFAFGYSEQEVQGMGNIRALFDGDLLVSSAELTEKDLIANIEVRSEHKSGAPVDLLVNVKRVSIRGGTRLYTCRDITDRRVVENALELSEARYRSLTEDVLDSSSVGTFVIGPELDVVWLNRAIERHFGLERSEILGRDIRWVVAERLAKVVDNPETFCSHLMATYEDISSSAESECHLPARDGREARWLHHWSRPIEHGLYAGGRIEHYTDYSARKAAENRLRYQRRRLQALRGLDEILLAAESPQKMAAAALATLEGLVEYDCGLVMTIDQELDLAECQAVRGACGLEIFVGQAIDFETSGLEVSAFQSEKLIEREDVSAEAPMGWARDQALLADMRKVIAARMVAHRRPIGILGLGRRQEKPFDQRAKETLQEVGDALAMGIQGHQLLEREQGRAAELDGVRKASVQISSQLELRPVLDTICQQAMRLLPGQDCNIFLYDGQVSGRLSSPR